MIPDDYLKDQATTHLKLPTDLKSHLLQLESVERFRGQGYPKATFSDNVLQHTLRCVAFGQKLARQLNRHHPGLLDSSKVARLLWIHDLVEIGLRADIPSPLKRLKPQINAAAEAAEKQHALKILKPKDYLLWLEFEAAKEILSGHKAAFPVSTEAIFSRLIDVADGDIYFHSTLSLWAQTRSIRRIPDYALSHSFIVSAQYLSVIQPHQIWSKFEPFLQSQIHFTQMAWKSVPQANYPPVMRRYLVQYA